MANRTAYAFLILAAVTIAGCSESPPQRAVSSGFTCFLSGSQSFSQQLSDYDVAAVAKVVHKTPWNGLGEPTATYEIVDMLKGQALVAKGSRVTSLLEGGAQVGDYYLLVSDAKAGLEWQLLTSVSPAEREYVTALFQLPTAAERLQYYLQHLDSADDSLARDATDELFYARYADLHALKPHLNHELIIERLQDPEIKASQRRIYFNLLSLCGSAADVPLLEEILRSKDKKLPPGLDCAIACHLTLGGEAGLPLIEELYLRGDGTGGYPDYARAYSAIMALRFHLRETHVIDRERLIASLRVMLERPELADLVIPDLAQEQDWSCLERLADMFKNADTEKTWLRVPVINYLRRCPLPQAKEALAECERIDPNAAKRARTFLPDESIGETGKSPEK